MTEATAGAPLLEVEQLRVEYGGVRALQGLSLLIFPGQFVVLLGPNGAGKTTTLRAVSGLVKTSGGQVRLNGENLSRTPAHARTAAGLGHVPEGRRVFPEHTVHENLLLGGFVHRRNASSIRASLDEVYDLFPRLRERGAQLAGTLSGGEAQMLAVARALMCRPKLLMLDEPSLGLAPLRVAEMFDYLSRLHRASGLAILLVEQQATLALRLADHGYVLEHGRVGLQGSALQLRADQRVQAVYLGGAQTATGSREGHLGTSETSPL